MERLYGGTKPQGIQAMDLGAIAGGGVCSGDAGKAQHVIE
jgi:hypothetical protein